MAKVLIVDENEKRRKTLTAQLRASSHVVSSIAMINMDNLQNIVTSHDVLLLLHQDKLVLNSIIQLGVYKQLKKIITDDAGNHQAREIDTISFVDAEDEKSYEAILTLIDECKSKGNAKQIIAEDPTSRAMFDYAKKAATTTATVMLTGETGTGKEILAQYIHQESNLKKGPFISLNCAALPEHMIESILFGHEKGAFTSAISSYMGKFEQAHNGTIFLDEISELPVSLQAKLLRVLQEREIERLGGRRIIKVNVRVITASNLDLQQQVNIGKFRKDLYYRLNVIRIVTPSLRQRRLDIIPLAQFFIQQHASEFNAVDAELSDSAKEKLLSYNWPGNIRELDNVIQRSLIVANDKLITASDIILDNHDFTNSSSQDVGEDIKFNSILDENEACVILEELNKADGSRNIAAKRLNISPRTLRYKIAKLKAIGLQIP